MALKQARHVGIFLLVTLGLHLGFKALDWPGSLAALVFIPPAYAIFHLLKGIIELLKGQKRTSLNSVTIALLFGLIFNKFYYEYYNLLFSILVLIFLAWVVRLSWKKDKEDIFSKNKVTLLVLLILNIILTSIPDGTVLNYISNPAQIRWQRLTWDDYLGVPDSSFADAKTGLGIQYKTSKVYNYPPAVVIEEMCPKHSWVRINDSIKPNYRRILLEHEQGHFDIVELYKRKICDTISKSWGISEKDVESIILFWYKKLDAMQDSYDVFTNHGTDTLNQHSWTNFMQEILHDNRVPNPSKLEQFALTNPKHGFTNKAEAENKLVNGKREGKWFEYIDSAFIPVPDSNSAVLYRLVNFKDGEPYGTIRTYYLSGKLFGESPQLEGKTNGIVKEYYESGKLHGEYAMEYGVEYGVEKWYYESGKLKSEIPYSNGKRNGLAKWYYEDGILRVQAFYRNGEEGENIHYDENGKQREY